MTSPTLPTRGALALLAAAAFGCAACSDDVAPETWIHVARLDGPAAEGKSDAARLEVNGTVFEMVQRDSSHWLEARLTRADWTPTDEPNLWATPMPLLKVGRASDGESPMRLEAPGETFVDWSTQWLLEGRSFGVPGTFRAAQREVQLQLAEGVEPPAQATLGFSADHAHLEVDRWRVAGRRFSGEGFAVWPGQSLEREVRFAPSSVLRVATCVESAVREPGQRSVTFRVRLGQELLLEHEQDVAFNGSFAWHTIPLPAGTSEGTLRFECDGPFAYTSFMTPTIGPADPDALDPRDAADEPRDVVVFLADTFRADNMDTFGGTHGVTPNLDRFASGALRFPQAWSVCTSTLSAHSSLFSGLYPRQTGLIDQSTMLPEAIDTIAERLARHGYRTGAITDKGFVSQYAGMAQGFQWFDEWKDDMDATVERARAFLEADDGRPVFLFVQTYRVHHPYVVDDALRAALADKLTIEGEYEEWMGEFERLPRKDRGTPEALRIIDALRRLYLGATYDLDRGFGDIERFLVGRDFFANGALIVTSDHGEAFGEHGDLLHSGIVYEEQTRIPLMIRADGLEPRTVLHPASLIDLAPTIADLTHIPHDRRWVGESLLTIDAARPLFAFQCRRGGQLSAAAIIDAQRKVIGSEESLAGGEIYNAYDLSSDPVEAHDLAGTDVTWPTELVRERRDELEFALRPQFNASVTELDGQRLEELQQLGYIGDDE